MERFNEQLEREDYKLAMLIATLYNVNLEKFDRKKPFTADEILKGKEIQTDDQMYEMAKVWTEFEGGEVKDG